jgi:hypothetical protein
LVYLYAKLIDDTFEYSYEVFYIDASLIYIVYFATALEEEPNGENSKAIKEEIIEYIVLEGKPVIFNTQDSVLEDLEKNERLSGLVEFLESKLE